MNTQRPAVSLPRPQAPAPSKRQVMLARERNSRETTDEAFTNEDTADDSARIQHETAGKVTLWEPTQYGYMPKSISAANIEANLDMGWLTECGDCGGNHDGNLNACPERTKRPTGHCPVCRKQFFDRGTEANVSEGVDEAEVEIYANSSTPQQRLKADIDLHIIVYHPADSAAYGAIDTRPAARAF